MITEQRLQKLEECVTEIHETVIRLETKFNGGPGSWPACKQHTEAQQDHETRLRWTEKKLNMALGVIAFVSLVATVIGIWSTLSKHHP